MDESRVPPSHVRVAMIALVVAFAAFQVRRLVSFHAPGWDESVYGAMRDYLASGGRHGYVETERTIGFPLLLLALPGIVAARWFVFAMALACLVVSFRIASRRSCGWWSIAPPLLLALFPPFYSLTIQALTEIPALLLLLLALDALLARRFVLAGACAALAATVRLPFLVYVPVLALGALLVDGGARRLLRFAAGAAFALPVLLVQAWAFRRDAGGVFAAMMLPLTEQVAGTRDSPYVWFYRHPLAYWLDYLGSWTPLWPLALVGVAFAIAAFLRRPRDGREDLALALAFAVPFAAVLVSPRKEYRYLLVAAPGLVLFMVDGARRLVERFVPAPRAAAATAVGILLLGVPAAIGLPALVDDGSDVSRAYYDSFLTALRDVPESAVILTSTPVLRTRGKLVVGNYDNDSFWRCLTSRSFDYVCYTPRDFPSAEGDRHAAELEGRIVGWLRRHYVSVREWHEAGDTDYLFARRRP